MAMKRPGERSVSPRSDPVVAIATPQPWLGSPSTSVSGTNTSSRNTSAKPSSPSRRSTPRTVTPGDCEVDEEVREAAVAFGFGVGAEEAEEVRAERAARRPRLLAREPPAAAGVVAHALALDAGEVAARVGLRPALAPRLLAGRHLGQDAVLLLLRAELEDRRREQEDAVLRDALRRAGGVVLLLEDQPLPQARLAAAVLAGPRHHRVAGVEQRRSHSRWAAKPARVSPDGRAGRGTWAASQSRHSARNCSSAALNVRSIGGRDRSGGRRWQESSGSGHCCQGRAGRTMSG